MTELITTLSMLAALVGVLGNIPQLITMLRTRSSSGQSIAGWMLGVSANLALGFVNAVGYHADLLAIGNALSLSSCLAAIVLVRQFRSPAQEPPAVAAAVTEMHTQEFVVLRDAVLAEHHRRTGELQLAAA